MVLDERRLQVADVVDDVLDDFHFGDFAVLGHVGHQLLQFRQVLLDLELVLAQFAHFAVRDHRRRTSGAVGFHHSRNSL